MRCAVRSSSIRWAVLSIQPYDRQARTISGHET
jgi:hypothetical protein